MKSSERENVARKSKKARSAIRDFIKEVKSLHFARAKKTGQCKDLPVAFTTTAGLGFEYTKVNAQNFNYFISLNVIWLLYITFN